MRFSTAGVERQGALQGDDGRLRLLLLVEEAGFIEQVTRLLRVEREGPIEGSEGLLDGAAGGVQARHAVMQRRHLWREPQPFFQRGFGLVVTVELQEHRREPAACDEVRRLRGERLLVVGPRLFVALARLGDLTQQQADLGVAGPLRQGLSGGVLRFLQLPEPEGGRGELRVIVRRFWL